MKKRGLILLILIIILISGCYPDKLLPPKKDYELGKAILSRNIEDAKARNIIEPNQPFLIENHNSSKAVLLLHGFTASPWEMKELGEYLNDKGFMVYGALLKGHGTNPSELEKTKWEDWYEDSLRDYKALAMMANETYIIGQSTGGALGFLISEMQKVDGLISISSPIYIQDSRAKFAWLFKLFKKNTEANTKSTEKSYYYQHKPISSVDELNQLIGKYKNQLCMIDSPVLIIQPKNDTTVAPKSANYLYNNIKSYEKIIWINSSNHVLTTGKDKTKIFKLSTDFINNISKQKDLYNSYIGCKTQRGDNELQYLEGILQIGNVFLAIVAGILAISLFKSTFKRESLKAWPPLIIALILFALEEILGALRSFKIFETPYLTHIVPSFIMGFLIWALIKEINYDTLKSITKKVCKK